MKWGEKMDTEQLVGTMIGAGIALAVIDRIGSKPRKKRKSLKVKRLTQK